MRIRDILRQSITIDILIFIFQPGKIHFVLKVSPRPIIYQFLKTECIQCLSQIKIAFDMYFCYYLFQHPEGCRPLQDNEDIQVHESLEFKDKFRKHDAKAYLISINITGILTMNIKTGDNAKINCYTRVNAAILTTCRILLASPFYRAYRDFKCKRCLHCVI